MSKTDGALSAANSLAAPERSRVSGIVASEPSSTTTQITTQTQRMWGFSLAEQLPCMLSSDGVVAVAGDFGRIARFLAAEYGMFAEEAQGSLPERIVSERKSEYLKGACDLVELRHAGVTIGALIGAPEDWSSYYVRVFALRRDFQRPAMTRRFIRDCLFTPLAEHGVERICADTSPCNTAMSRLFTELHFHVTGSHLSDRWGPMVRYTRFLSPACEAEFRRKFGGGAPADGRGSTKNEEVEA